MSSFIVLSRNSWGIFSKKKLRRNPPAGNWVIQFNFQWTKTLYQNNLKHIAFFFYIFQELNI